MEMHRRVPVSLLWVTVSLNIVFADVLSLYVPGVLPEVMNGTVEGVTLSESLMLVAAFFIQIPITMIILTYLLSPRLLRPVTMVAVLITAAFVIGGGSLKPHYLFFAFCEVMALSAILYLTWRRQ